MKLIRQLSLVPLIALTGCSEDPKSAIIGNWEGISLKQDLHFFKNGRAQILDRKHGTYEGTCKFFDNDQLSCNFDRFAYPVIRSVDISGDKLYLTNKNGQEEIYRRK